MAKLSIFSGLLAVLLWHPAAVAEETPRLAVGSRAFEIEVGAKGEGEAKTADLFMRRPESSAWQYVGSCQTLMGRSGNRFVRDVMVSSDGEYLFSSRAGDAAGKALPPTPQEEPQVRVVVDTIKPILMLNAPLGFEIFRVGQNGRISWTAQDDYLGKNPIAISYSRDGGKNWLPIASGIANTGIFDWKVPQVRSPAILIRVTARDMAGNSTFAITEKPIRVDGALVGDDQSSGGQEQQDAPPIVAPSEKKEIKADDTGPKVRPSCWQRYTSRYSAYIAWIYAGNLVRQGRLKDSLRFFQTAVEEDPKFHFAWNDMTLVYKDLCAFEDAEASSDKALEIDPTNSHYLHCRGEIYQTRFHTNGIPRLKQGPVLDIEMMQDRAYADIKQAMKYYGMAIEQAQKQGRLAECAASYFRLGEVCYYVNYDHLGARMYWEKVLDLHSPTPAFDFVVWDRGTDREQTSRDEYFLHTRLKVGLDQWQKWARSYVRQLDEMESRGDLSPHDPSRSNPNIDVSEDESVREPVLPAPDPYVTRPHKTANYNLKGYGSDLDSGNVRQTEDEYRPAPRHPRIESGSGGVKRFFHWPFGRKSEAAVSDNTYNEYPQH